MNEWMPATSKSYCEGKHICPFWIHFLETKFRMRGFLLVRDKGLLTRHRMKGFIIEFHTLLSFSITDVVGTAVAQPLPLKVNDIVQCVRLECTSPSTSNGFIFEASKCVCVLCYNKMICLPRSETIDFHPFLSIRSFERRRNDTKSDEAEEEVKKNEWYAYETSEKSSIQQYSILFDIFIFRFSLIQHRIVTLWTWSVYKSPIYLLWTAELYKKQKRDGKKHERTSEKRIMDVLFRYVSDVTVCERVCVCVSARERNAEEVFVLLLLTFARTQVSECLCVV